LGQSRGRKKYIYLGREDVVLVHPQNGFNCLILNCALVAAGSLQPLTTLPFKLSLYICSIEQYCSHLPHNSPSQAFRLHLLHLAILLTGTSQLSKSSFPFTFVPSSCTAHTYLTTLQVKLSIYICFT